MNCSENMDKFWPAFFNLQQDIDPKIIKETEAYNYNYAPIEVVWEHVRPVLKKHGFVYVETNQDRWSEGEFCVNLTGTLVHVESGQFIESNINVPVRKHDPQEAGQSITYGRRYNMVTIFNLTPVGEDDDAQPKRQANKAKVTKKSVKTAMSNQPQNTGRLRLPNSAPRQNNNSVVKAINENYSIADDPE